MFCRGCSWVSEDWQAPELNESHFFSVVDLSTWSTMVVLPLLVRLDVGGLALQRAESILTNPSHEEVRHNLPSSFLPCYSNYMYALFPSGPGFSANP